MSSGSQIKIVDPERDEAVQYAWDTIWQGLVDHDTDKQYYPRYVSYAVGFTVAQVFSLYNNYWSLRCLINCELRTFNLMTSNWWY